MVRSMILNQIQYILMVRSVILNQSQYILMVRGMILNLLYLIRAKMSSSSAYILKGSASCKKELLGKEINKQTFHFRENRHE